MYKHHYVVSMQARNIKSNLTIICSITIAVFTIACIAHPTHIPSLSSPLSSSSQSHTAFAQIIENDQYYIGDDGSLHVVGEIINDLDVPLSRAVVHVSIYDENENTIFEKETSSLVNTIMPGMRGPFDLIITNIDITEYTMQNNEIKYIFDLDYDFATPKRQVIDILESEMSRDRHGNWIITGMVVNKGEITANTISVVATIYDDTRNVAAVTRVHTEPDYLGAGESTFFAIAIPDKTHTIDAATYDLVAESEEYAAVPEFPIGTVILLVATFSAYVLVTRLVKLPMTNLISATNVK